MYHIGHVLTAPPLTPSCTQRSRTRKCYGPWLQRAPEEAFGMLRMVSKATGLYIVWIYRYTTSQVCYWKAVASIDFPIYRNERYVIMPFTLSSKRAIENCYCFPSPRHIPEEMWLVSYRTFRYARKVRHAASNYIGLSMLRIERSIISYPYIKRLLCRPTFHRNQRAMTRVERLAI